MPCRFFQTVAAVAIAAATIGTLSTECLAETSKKLVNVAGEVVAIWDGKISKSVVVNTFTNEIADGSEIAKKTRPGIIYLIDADFAVLTEYDSNGNLLAQGDSGKLVANHNVFTLDGEALFPGESLGAVSFISEGFVKNPGPDPVTVSVTKNGSIELFVIAPGDGFYVGDQEAGTQAATTHEPGCACNCSGAGGQVITVPCPGDEEQQQIGVGEKCNCGSADDQPCAISVGGQLQFGTTSGCRFAYLPSA